MSDEIHRPRETNQTVTGCEREPLQFRQSQKRGVRPSANKYPATGAQRDRLLKGFEPKKQHEEEKKMTRQKKNKKQKKTTKK